MDRKLLYRYFKNETSPAEEARVNRWIEADEENFRRFQHEREVFNTIAVHAKDMLEEAGGRGKKTILRRITGYAAGAAAVLGLVLATGYVTRHVVRGELERQFVELSVPVGQQLHVTLADGTDVWLNTGTTLKYPVAFGGQRRVVLNGEAMFDVRYDARSPFIVETFSCDLEVLGTKFNVNAYSDSGSFSTSLLEGKLKVTNRLSPEHESFVLDPNQSVRLQGERLAQGAFDNNREFLWTEGIISLEGVPFEELMKEFERYFDVTIEVQWQSAPRFSRGKIRIKDGLDHALKVMQITSGIKYEIDEDRNTVIVK